MIMFTFNDFEIIAVTARNLCPRPLWEQIPRIREAGITRVILREKDLSEDAYTVLAEKVLRACEECCVTLVIHNFSESARKLGIYKLHMPISLLTPSLCREYDTTGTSVHSTEQLLQAEAIGADYIIAGHIYATDCKKGLTPRGPVFLKEICNQSKMPVYAIGGSTPDRIPELRLTGAAGACIMSGAMQL